MSQGGVFLGLCRFCGGNIRSNMKFCGGCGKEITAGVLVSAPSGNTDPLAPLVTKDFASLERDSKKRRLVEARLSLVNPYGDWGKLICDDSKRKMWIPSHLDGVNGRYAGNVFCCSSMELNYARFSSKYRSFAGNFAYQVYVNISGKNLGVSVIFRREKYSKYSWEEASYYEFTISSGDEGKVFANFKVVLGHMHISLKDYNVSEFCPDIPNEGVLLGVVARGENIDLYVNLVHIGSVEDYSISSGTVGLGVSGGGRFIFSHAKVWRA